MDIAKTILEQLGGGRFAAMTGAKKFTSINPKGNIGGLYFRLPSNFAKNGINAVQIVLHPSDTYIVTFLRTNKTISTHEDIYCDDLVPLFERETGLYTSF